MLVAVDFDGTISDANYPEINLIPEVVDILLRATNNGHRLILWTCRHGDILDKSVEACRNAGLEFVAINKNDPQQVAHWKKIWGDDESSAKIYADMYIDDRAMLPWQKIDWSAINKLLNGGR
jgi:hypothetical protein